MSFRGWEKVPVRVAGGEAAGIAPVVISASRATDIPAFFGQWFMRRLGEGYVRWVNRFNGLPQYISFERVRVVVFWTKNAGPMVRHLPELDYRGINYYFLFTLNDYEKETLEPRLPPLATRIDTFRRLSDLAGRNRTVWRFDPLILGGGITVQGLLDRVSSVGERIRDHTERLIISFLDLRKYPRVIRNMREGGFGEFREFTPEEMTEFGRGLREINRLWNLSVSACGESEDLGWLGISRGKCVDDRLMARAFAHDSALMEFLDSCRVSPATVSFRTATGEAMATTKDRGQRAACGCIPSKDIGQYTTCPHGCTYCYANESPRLAMARYLEHAGAGSAGETIVDGRVAPPDRGARRTRAAHRKDPASTADERMNS